MKNKNSLIFIGEKMSKQDMKITSKPSFYDAVLLSNQSPQPTMSASYQSIPLGTHTNISICLSDHNIEVSCCEESLQIFEGNNPMSEEEVFDVLNHFVVKQGNTVTLLGIFPYGKNRPGKRKKERVAAVSKKMGKE